MKKTLLVAIMVIMAVMFSGINSFAGSSQIWEPNPTVEKRFINAGDMKGLKAYYAGIDLHNRQVLKTAQQRKQLERTTAIKATRKTSKKPGVWETATSNAIKSIARSTGSSVSSSTNRGIRKTVDDKIGKLFAGLIK